MKKIIPLLLGALLLMTVIPMQAIPVLADDGENVAFEKTVTALSSRDGYNVQALTDGNYNSTWAGTSIEGSWITIDLEQEYVIDTVVLHTYKGETAAHFRRNMNVQFSNSPDFTQYEQVIALGGKESEFGVPVTVSAPSKTPYRYVRVTKTIATTFALCEVEVYGRTLSDGIVLGTDVVGTKLEGPVALLSYLGMMEAEDALNELFGVGNVLTRGEAAEAVVRAFAGNVSFTGGIPFTDVPVSHPCYQAVMTACHLGYVTGDSNTSFRPNDFITKTEFMFMVLRAIGYDDVVQKVMENSPARVIKLADDLKLLKNTSGDYSGPVTRGDAAQIFYNALLTPEFNMYAAQEGRLIFNEEEDYLRRHHNIVLTQGVVEENGISTLSGNPKSSRTAAVIGGTAFTDSQGLLDAYLGKEVVVATNQDAPKSILLAWPTAANAEVVLPAGNLTSTEADIAADRIVALDADGDAEKYSLENEFYVVKNDMAHPYYEPADLMLSNGQLRLLDNDRDGVYEVVFIEAYSLHYLSTAFYDDDTFSFIDSDNTRKTLQREYLTLINGNSGGNASLKKVASGTVIKLFETDGGERNKVYAYYEPVKGTLEVLSGEEVAVSGVSYPLSLAYKRATRAHEPVPGETVSLFVDEAGEVLWIERDTDSANDGWVIAFSQQIATGSGLKADLGFRLFTENSEWKELYTADKVTVDGTPMEKAELIQMVQDAAAGRFTEQLLRYKLDGYGKIKAIDTVESALAEDNGMPSFGLGVKIDAALYTSGSQAFWTAQEMLSPAKRNTPTFVIPTVNGRYTTDASFDNFYQVQTVYSIAGANNHKTMNLQAYMPDKSGYPACFLTTQGYSAATGGAGSMETVTSESSPFMLVESVVTGVTSEGDVALKIRGMQITSSGMKDVVTILSAANLNMIESGILYQEQPDCLESNKLVSLSALLALENKEDYITSVKELGFGDIIRYQSGVPTVRAIERIFDYDAENPAEWGENPAGDTWYIMGGNNTAHYIGYYRYQLGSLANVEKDAFTVNTIAGKQETYLNGAFANVYVCDMSGNKPKLKKVADLAQYEGSDVQLMLYSYNGGPLAIVVYPY